MVMPNRPTWVGVGAGKSTWISGTGGDDRGGDVGSVDEEGDGDGDKDEIGRVV